MSAPRRAKDQTQISISLPKEMLKMMNARTNALGLTRSQYIVFLARRDVQQGNAFVIEEAALPASPPPVPVSSAPVSYDRAPKRQARFKEASDAPKKTGPGAGTA